MERETFTYQRPPSKRLVYTPRVEAAGLVEQYQAMPYNLATVRAARAVERATGCAYIREVGRRLAARDGAGYVEGGVYDYLAYAAGKVLQALAARREARELARDGWRVAGDLPSGARVEARLSGKVTPGRVVESGGVKVFLPARHRRNGFRLAGLYVRLLATTH